ncbi:TetR/AcrR family transcriptional regulator [Leucobacter luti]|uniref:TetR family transcriptional regulator n=1 Tax=Leucobacter luti TaxID=340320 RepID=A0A4Q7U8G2_9MICO|nr:TetR/AcrR family transcriptional regulator [Leucobacter luti]MBL3700534.1 TetR/AcrR family transcriptional regulator [Leucobacter luti]RZT68632.1 TetR family transcriptional regulator [Leucobacter luti]
MDQRSDRAREALLDAAEQLYATQGIDAVSNRKIAEHAGSANHSAVAYHFTNRDGLIRELIERHVAPLTARRAELFAQLGDSPSVHDIVRCRVLPYFEHLDALPSPSWRAQFLAQVRSSPAMASILEESVRAAETAEDTPRLRAHVTDIPERVLRARSGIIAHLVLGACAEQERQMNAGKQRGSWIQVGYFFIDAAAGMLTAPVTRLDATVPALPDEPLL